jgi:transglutaminase-like putative cysteine protease
MFRNHMMQRITAGVVLTTFVSLSMYPLTAAAQVKDAAEKAGLLPKQKDEGIVGNAKRYINTLGGSKGTSTASTADERFSQLLNDIHEDLKAAVPQTAMSKDAHKYAGGTNSNADESQTAANGKKDGKQTRAIGPNMRIETGNIVTIKPLPGTDIVAKIKSIKNKAAEVKGLYAEIDQSFKETEQHLKNARLPQEILERHNQAVFQYESRKAEFDRLIGKIEQAPTNSADQQSALADLGSFMAKYPNAKPYQYTDPNKLPLGTNSGKVRDPHLTKEQYQTSLFPPKYNKVMLAGTIPDGLKLAQATLPQTPNAPDIAETEDVQITQAIRVKAAELNNNPVQIYNWVRNNIAFIPSYGSIQGSDMTLMNKRGNAFDTASLLIALYRAAGTPARYVYGTIEVPADKVMNWVGGVTKPQAAQSLLGQGGIPNVALVSGGTVKAIRMEHVWVEAYVDYTPSRGAVNKAPQTWMPMDASFKQYMFSPGLNVAANVPINAQTIVDQLKQGATINETEGYVQNLNQANLQSQLAAYQNQIKAFAEGQKQNPTAEDLLGVQTIVKEEWPILLGSLPYKTLSIGNTFQSLPENLKWKFKTNIYSDDWISDGSTPIIEVRQSTTRLAGKKITLSFIPASQADQTLVNSYLPKPHADGTPIQPSEMPASLPGYLLRVKAEFRVDGQVVAQTAEAFTMGSTLKQSSQYFNPSKGYWEGGDDNSIMVGEYNAIAMNLQGTDSHQLGKLQTKLARTKAAIDQYMGNTGDTTPLQNLTKEDIAGDIVYSGILAYFADVDQKDDLTARGRSDVVNYRLPSYGRFFSAANPRYYFGVVRNVSFPGVAMDVDYLVQHVSAKDGDRSKELAYMRQVGAAGSLAENSVPDQILRGQLPDSPDFYQGVSAVRVLAIAAAQGQKIYTLTTANRAQHGSILASLLISQDVKVEISNALATGKEVTVHDRDIFKNGWTGAGYIILDPETGAGAYKIEGGNNGAWLGALSIFAWLFSLIMVGTPLGLWAILVSTVAGMFANILACVSSGGDATNTVIAYTVLALVSLTAALLLIALFAGPGLLVALLINAIFWRLFNTWMVERTRSQNGCL